MKKRSILTVIFALLFTISIPCDVHGLSYDVSLTSIDNIVLSYSDFAKESKKRIDNQKSDNWDIDSKMSNLYKKISLLDKESATYDDDLKDLNDQLDLLGQEGKQGEYQLDILKLNEKNDITQLAMSAKIEYLKYIDLQIEADEHESKIIKEKNRVKVMEKKYKRGIISLNELKGEEDALYQLIQDRTEYQDNLDEQMDILKSSLGLNSGDSITILSMNGEDNTYYKEFSSIILSNDIVKAKSASIEAKKAEETIRYYRYQNNSYREYQQSITDLDKVNKNVEKEVKSEYKLIIRSIDRIDKNYSDKVLKAKNKKNRAYAKYKKGYLSKNEYLDVKDEYNNVLKDKKKDIKGLLPDLLKYQLLVNGFN